MSAKPTAKKAKSDSQHTVGAGAAASVDASFIDDPIAYGATRAADETGRIKWLGTKNLTARVQLSAGVQGLPPQLANQDCFIKVGESHADNEFQTTCSQLREQLGLCYVKTHTCMVKLDAEAWDEDSCYGYLRGGVEKRGLTNDHVSKIRASEKKCGGAVSMLISTAFDGQCPTMCRPKLSSVNIEERTGGQGGPDAFFFNMLKILCFRRFVASKDTNMRNVLMSGPDILSVDETPQHNFCAEELRKKRWITRPSLLTAQNIGKFYTDGMLGQAAAQHKALHDFLCKLVQVPRANLNAWNTIVGVGDQERAEVLEKIHEKPPFDRKTLDTLKSGRAADIRKQWKKLLTYTKRR